MSGGISVISSSKFIQSGAVAQFKSGITSSFLECKNSIFAEGFEGIAIGNSDTSELLKVGTASADGTFDECVTTVGTNFRLSASGDFNHFTFIEKRSDGWFQISSGSQNGLEEKSFVDGEGKSSAGVYEYFVLAMSTSSKQTVVKGTTVKVNPSS